MVASRCPSFPAVFNWQFPVIHFSTMTATGSVVPMVISGFGLRARKWAHRPLGRITALVDTEPEQTALARLRATEATGRPLGSDEFVMQLERLMERRLRRQKPGRKVKAPQSAGELFSRETTSGRTIG
jgi:hypothetical protein